ncbi:MAG: 1-acyl-sn-glycerol-3-phosphate acyltransferase [Verrucomicrobia bacterium]|nr:1-acyl-sn-glycerol-3-phosphate acyltransferase [Verrucomicrobiota bacterium]
MEKNSKFKPFFSKLEQYKKEGSIPPKYCDIIEKFYLCYQEAIASAEGPEDYHHEVFLSLLDLIKQQCREPYDFQPYHALIRKPFDYYQFGIDLVKPLVDLPHSTLSGQDNLKNIVASLEKGENTIFLANHQIEADPQAISIMLENSYPRLAEEMIFVAGERVITDPLAVPASMGRNLLCIYSKRYIDHPPELKMKKQLHNKRTMELMSQLLSEGGKAIYVAPSGGRDRPNAEGVVEVAPFDAQSIEMFYLMSQRAGHPTHFYPLALKTYEMLPPPQTIQVELGEARVTKRAPIHIAFGAKIDMENFPGGDSKDKHERRSSRAEYICNLVRRDYAKFP